MAGRPSTKTKTEEVVEETIDYKSELDKAKKDNDSLAEMLLKLQSQLNDVTTKLATSGVTPVKETTLTGKKIRCINLMRNPLNVTTEPSGRGKAFEFAKYGDSKLIKFDELSDIVSAYPNTMEQGLLYIANPDAVVELGLEEEYKNIHTKEMLDELIYLRRDMDVDIFTSMPKALQESTAIEIARLINVNETIDWNRLKKIKDETGIDIDEIAKSIVVEKELLEESK